MAAVDLRDVLFRAFFPELEDDTLYDPVGPGDYTPVGSGVQLSGIKFRAYQEDTEGEQN